MKILAYVVVAAFLLGVWSVCSLFVPGLSFEFGLGLIGGGALVGIFFALLEIADRPRQLR